MISKNERHNNKILSVVIPSYNTEKYIDDCLPTFLDDSINDLIEILIVNDGSKDNTLLKARYYESKFPGTIRVIDKPNGGHGSTINRGIQEATGLYFKVVDGDDWVDTANFIKYVQYLSENSENDLVVCPYVTVDETTLEKKVINDFKYFKEGGVDVDYFYSHVNAVCMHSITYKTNKLRDNNIELDEHMFYVDQEYNLYPLAFINTISYVNIPVYQYRVASATQSMNKKNMQKNKEMHKTVFWHCFENFTKVSDLLSESKKSYFFKSLSRLAFTQLRIELSIPNNINDSRIFLTSILPLGLNWRLSGRVLKIYKLMHFHFTFIISKYFQNAKSF